MAGSGSLRRSQTKRESPSPPLPARGGWGWGGGRHDDDDEPKGCVDWGWYYPFHYGPLVGDVARGPAVESLGGLQAVLAPAAMAARFSLGGPFLPFEVPTHNPQPTTHTTPNERTNERTKQTEPQNHRITGTRRLVGSTLNVVGSDSLRLS